MADDRPIEGTEDQLGRLQRELEDLKSTMLARLPRRPTGDIESTIRTTPKDGTLLLQGQLVTRAAYPALWQWVVDQNLLRPGLFGPGDGTTTFGLPNFSGRVLIGVGTLGADTYVLGQEVGAAARALTLANMPAHDHNVTGSANSGGSHFHAQNFQTGTGGGHWGHNVGVGTLQGGTTNNIEYGDAFRGDHTHHVGGDTGTTGSHTHSLNITEAVAGSGTAFDNRPPSIAVNWMIWT